jgi:hypothetical protein
VFTGDDAQAVLSQQMSIEVLTGGVGVENMNAKTYEDYVRRARLVTQELGIPPGKSSLIVNGRVCILKLHLLANLKIRCISGTGRRSIPNWRVRCRRLQGFRNIRISEENTLSFSWTREHIILIRWLRSVVLINSIIGIGLTFLLRTDVADMVSMAASIISTVQLPDPSESGPMDAPQRHRTRNYQILADSYTYVCLSITKAFSFLMSTYQVVQIGEQ